MKCILVLCLLGLVALSVAAPEGRKCLWVLGACYKECPEGTYGYAIGCGKVTPEATCDNPNPVEEDGIFCDFSACYCDPPTVRNTETDQCVPLDQCPKKE